MPGKAPNLKPHKHPQLDFFIADILDAPLKSDKHTMEFPMFSLAKKRDTEERKYRYEMGNGEFVEVRITPSTRGLATQDDKDFLIVAISQYMRRLNRNQGVARKIRIRPKDMLVATNRYTGGRDYKLMQEALERMEGTRVRTNISAGGVRQREGFGIIDGWKIVERPSDGRLDYIELTFSEWTERAMAGKEVLTLNPDYFRLPSGLMKRLYEIARKHCGHQPHWACGLEKLHFKCGSQAILKRFRQSVRELFPEKNGQGLLDLLEYTMSYSAERDVADFYRKPELVLKEFTSEYVQEETC